MINETRAQVSGSSASAKWPEQRRMPLGQDGALNIAEYVIVADADPPHIVLTRVQLDGSEARQSCPPLSRRGFSHGCCWAASWRFLRDSAMRRRCAGCTYSRTVASATSSAMAASSSAEYSTPWCTLLFRTMRVSSRAVMISAGRPRGRQLLNLAVQRAVRGPLLLTQFLNRRVVPSTR
ncbi:hypothetical protein [Streptomyces sp. 900105245]